MKKMSIIVSIILSTGLLIGCGGKSESGQITPNESSVKVEAKQEEKSSKKSDELLQKLQPGQFKSKLAEAINTYDFASYEDLLRRPKENIDKKVKVMGTVQQVDIAEDGALEVYLHDTANNRFYFVYYFPDIIDQNVIQGDVITALCKMENVTEISTTNGLGVEFKTTVPLLCMDYLLDNSYTQSIKSIGSFLGTENKFDFELVGESKDFEDLSDKHGHVFALKSKQDGTYDSKYIFVEKGILRHYTPTVDGKNINGEETSLSSKAIYGAQ